MQTEMFFLTKRDAHVVAWMLLMLEEDKYEMNEEEEAIYRSLCEFVGKDM